MRFLLTGVAWQDSLLQSYRSISLSIQAVLIAVGSILLGASAITSSGWAAVLLFVQLIAVFILAWLAFRTMTGVILARGGDVTWWQERLREAEEKAFPEGERGPFTAFKSSQMKQRQLSTPATSPDPISETSPEAANPSPRFARYSGFA